MRSAFGLSSLFLALSCASAPTPADLGQSGSANAAAGGPAAGGSGGTGGASGVDCDPDPVTVTVPWAAINGQPASFYQSAEALTLASNIIYYQNPDHGWPKETDMTTRNQRRSGSTIDNRATTTQILYLSKVVQATGCPAVRDAVVNGIEYLFSGQYENGGWPQEFPNGEDYHTHITFNDDAMLHVLQLLRMIAEGVEPYTYLDESYPPRAADAVQRGIQCILDCQVITDGERTGWCAQHDEVTLEPAQARSYELPSLSGMEAVGIVRFLMTIPEPSAEVRQAIEGAVAWFEKVKITGIRVDSIADETQPTGEDRIVVEDPNADPIWARFYELETDVPIFSSRCEVPECDEDPFFMRRYSLAEIENERRVGYAWYGDWPDTLLRGDYPAWLERNPPE